MADRDWLAARFEEQRPHLHAVAYRMLGSTTEADDAVQDAWLRFSRADTTAVDNLRGWLTTVVARLCLDALRARGSRREDLAGVHLPDPIVARAGTSPGPDDEVVLADSVGLALLVVLETLSPAERLAFVLHDTFGLPFEEIAPIVDRTPTAARKLASRARQRLRGGGAASAIEDGGGVSPRRQRELVDAFLDAARGGDFEALLRILDPDVVVRADTGRLPLRGSAAVTRGAEGVAAQALRFRALAGGARIASVNGAPGYVVFSGNRPFAILGFSFARDRIAEIDILVGPERLARVDLSAIERTPASTPPA
jgi:RNA polymerase sigma factor (sigma-70 family)